MIHLTSVEVAPLSAEIREGFDAVAAALLDNETVIHPVVNEWIRALAADPSCATRLDDFVPSEKALNWARIHGYAVDVPSLSDAVDGYGAGVPAQEPDRLYKVQCMRAVVRLADRLVQARNGLNTYLLADISAYHTACVNAALEMATVAQS